MKFKKILWSMVLVLMLCIPNINFAYAGNGDVPFFDGTEGTFLESKKLQLSGKIVRPSKFYRPPEATGTHYYVADIHYPTLYNGSFSMSNQHDNLAQTIDFSSPFVRVTNDGFAPWQEVGDRMITDVGLVNESIIHNKYNGNGNFVLTNMNKHAVKRLNGFGSYGSFYWIRDMAYLSGGYAGTGIDPSINPFMIWVVRTSYPDITYFNTETDRSKDSPVKFRIEGFEYVSKGKGYAGEGQGMVSNPYMATAGERNRVKWELQISQGGQTVATKTGYMRSSPKINTTKPNEQEAGFFNDGGSITWQPNACGTFTAKLKVYDGVQRESQEKTTTFTIDQNCSAEVPPDTGDGDGFCQDNFNYKLDFAVNRIEGETAEAGTNISTPVEVSRTSFEAERNQYRNQLEQKIAQLKQELAQAESAKADAESALTSCRMSEEKDKDCSGNEAQLDAALQKIQEIKDKLACEEAKLQRLNQLESQYANTDPVVVLRHNGTVVGTQTVSLREGERKTLNFPWTLTSSGQIEAEINPSPRKYTNTKEWLV